MCFCFVMRINYFKFVNYITFFIINLVNSISGFLIMVLATSVLYHKEKYIIVFNVNNVAYPVATLFGSSVMFFFGVYGCYLTFHKCSHQRMQLSIYAVVILGLGIGDIVTSSKLLAMRDGGEESLTEHFREALLKYDEEIDINEKYVDFIHIELHCCGLHSYQEWMTKYKKPQPPISCCKYGKLCNTTSERNINTRGCMDLYIEAYKDSALNNGLPIMIFGIFHIFCSIVGFGLIYKEKQYEQRKIAESFNTQDRDHKSGPKTKKKAKALINQGQYSKSESTTMKGTEAFETQDQESKPEPKTRKIVEARENKDPDPKPGSETKDIIKSIKSQDEDPNPESNTREIAEAFNTQDQDPRPESNIKNMVIKIHSM